MPSGRELSYPGVANVIGNALRELNLEDVEPAGGSGRVPDDRRVSDVRRSRRASDGIERNDQSWITLEASVDAAAAACTSPTCSRARRGRRNSGGARERSERGS